MSIGSEWSIEHVDLIENMYFDRVKFSQGLRSTSLNLTYLAEIASLNNH